MAFVGGPGSNVVVDDATGGAWYTPFPGADAADSHAAFAGDDLRALVAQFTPAGTITVATGVVSGSTTLTYQICEAADPDNCDTAEVMITVDPNAIDAVDDDFSGTMAIDWDAMRRGELSRASPMVPRLVGDIDCTFFNPKPEASDVDWDDLPQYTGDQKVFEAF